MIAAIFGVFALAGAAMTVGGAWLIHRRRRPS
ncbi:LPXTG cell wall anchor domain-containing protein [Magnetospirillum sp. 15-1]|nr:LPXTG cell wall anchor domain-containing protein [Magnetospirillum sp. 15-1]